ncbi:murein L,D-transpeptidase [uncultured Enterovirga sp.]|uniref:L,D-transpeptidase family protein n=1 Tax=uncultured Enterovirga sp. TaxID=2026352 RepID=UPI0035CC1EAC
MSATRASGWIVGLGLLASMPAYGLPAGGAPADHGQDTVSAPTDLPIPAETLLRNTAGTEGVASRDLVLPEPPAVTVEIPAPARAQTAGGVFLDLPPAPVQITRDDILPGAIELRLADAKLPLPPKLSRRDREGLTAFYAASRYRSLWIVDGAWTARAQAVSDTLAQADAEGHDPADYPVPRLEVGTKALTAGDLAEAELKLSAAAYLYARNARGGRIDPSRISGLITPKLELPSVDAVLTALVASAEPDQTLVGYNPAYPGYRALRAKLADIRANRPAVARSLSTSAEIRQAAAGISDMAALPKLAPARLESDIVANMERWRWLPAQVSPRYILVNVPEFRLRLIEDGQVRHETRVIIGKTETPTPIFTGKLDHAVVNPSWFVPPSIIKKDFSDGVAKPGYTVTRRGKTVVVRQPPGPKNALGYIKLMFPNDHAVYLHDTPSRHLFGSASRAFSHGCVRVENPFALAGKIMGPDWTEERLKRLIGWGERYIAVPDKFPVNMAYFTVSVDEFGELKTFGDIYGFHRRVRAALGLGA